MSQRLNERVSELVAARVRFVHATVVRAQCPTSACPGDSAVVLADGSIEGFVGGQCAEGSVRTAAMEVLRSGEAVLLRVLPDGDASFPESSGAVTVVNPCLSGGALEIFLEPRLPATLVCVAGNSPIAESVVILAKALGFDVHSNAVASIGGAGNEKRGVDGEARETGDDLHVAGATALIVATHGRSEDRLIRRALDNGVPFIGLVASRARGQAVLDAMELNESERARVRTPVGTEIGARTAQEIALSILAEIVHAVRVDGLQAPEVAADAVVAPANAIDPNCGMTVTIGPDTPHLHRGGSDYWFCNPGCLAKFDAETSAAGVRAP